MDYKIATREEVQKELQEKGKVLAVLQSNTKDLAVELGLLKEDDDLSLLKVEDVMDFIAQCDTNIEKSNKRLDKILKELEALEDEGEDEVVVSETEAISPVTSSSFPDEACPSHDNSADDFEDE